MSGGGLRLVRLGARLPNSEGRIREGGRFWVMDWIGWVWVAESRCRANRLLVGGGWRLGGCCLGGVGGWWFYWDLDGRVSGGRAGGG